MTGDAVAAPAVPRRNRLGVAALVLAAVVAAAPIVAWIVVAILGVLDRGNPDGAVYVGLLGGFIVFTGVMGLLAPLALVAAVLGIVSLFRPGSKAPGVVAIILGTVGSLGLFWLPFVLAEVVPGW
jgi:hypothetical protein